MKYMDRRLLFPIVAVTAWAQQPSPAAAEAEAALRARVEEFFKLQVDKKYRQAEAMVAEDTKDDYYNGNKFNIKGFTIEKMELLDDNTRAKVTIKAKVTLNMPGTGTVDFEAPSATLWKLENGAWVWYSDSTGAVQTPFGAMKPQKEPGKNTSQGLPVNVPSISAIQSLVKIDRNVVELARDGSPQTVTVSNGLSGGVDIELIPARIEGLKTEVRKRHLEAGEMTTIEFRATGGGSANQVVKILVSPVGVQFDVQVNRR
jgi:hypothetical protein